MCSILIRWFEIGLIRMIIIHLYLMTLPKLHFRVFFSFSFFFFFQILSVTCKWFRHRSIPIASHASQQIFLSTFYWHYYHYHYHCYLFQQCLLIFIFDKTLVLKNISNSTYAFLNLVNNAGRKCEKFNRHNNKTAT